MRWRVQWKRRRSSKSRCGRLRTSKLRTESSCSKRNGCFVHSAVDGELFEYDGTSSSVTGQSTGCGRTERETHSHRSKKDQLESRQTKSARPPRYTILPSRTRISPGQRRGHGVGLIKGTRNDQSTLKREIRPRVGASNGGSAHQFSSRTSTQTRQTQGRVGRCSVPCERSTGGRRCGGRTREPESQR